MILFTKVPVVRGLALRGVLTPPQICANKRKSGPFIAQPRNWDFRELLVKTLQRVPTNFTPVYTVSFLMF